MKTAINCLLLLQTVFLFSHVSIGSTTANYAQVGAPPVIRDYRISERITNRPKVERIPLTNCNQVLIYLSQRMRYNQAVTLYNIVKAESGCRAWVKNPVSSAGGLAQILTSTWNAYGCHGNKYDPWDNLDCAIKIYRDVGYSAWEVCNQNVIRC